MDILISIFADYGYVAVFVMLLLCGFGLPIPEDITLVAGGIIAGLGYADVHTMFAVCMAGVLIGLENRDVGKLAYRFDPCTLRNWSLGVVAILPHCLCGDTSSILV